MDENITARCMPGSPRGGHVFCVGIGNSEAEMVAAIGIAPADPIRSFWRALIPLSLLLTVWCIAQTDAVINGKRAAMR